MIASDRKFKLAGIIHLHRITDTRMGGAAYKDLKMFQKFCGAESFPSVVLGTTMWPANPSREDYGREEELRTKFYQDMVNEGAKMMRHMNTEASALKILSHLIDMQKNGKPMVLAIQRELASEGATLLDTGAGQELEAEKIKIRESFEQKLKENEVRLDNALKAKDEELVKMRLEQQENLKKLLAEAKKREEDAKIRLEAEMKEQFEKKDNKLKEMQRDIDAMQVERYQPPPEYQGPHRSPESGSPQQYNRVHSVKESTLVRAGAAGGLLAAAWVCIVM